MKAYLQKKAALICPAIVLLPLMAIPKAQAAVDCTPFLAINTCTIVAFYPRLPKDPIEFCPCKNIGYAETEYMTDKLDNDRAKTFEIPVVSITRPVSETEAEGLLGLQCTKSYLNGQPVVKCVRTGP